jgi:streptogramin lyase
VEYAQGVGYVRTTAFTTPNQNGTDAIRLDGDGKVWVAFTGKTQSTSTRIAVFDPSSGNYAAFVPYTSKATDIAIDRSGNVWLANAGAGGLVEVVGAAAPQLTPFSLTNAGGGRP